MQASVSRKSRTDLPAAPNPLSPRQRPRAGANGVARRGGPARYRPRYPFSSVGADFDAVEPLDACEAGASGQQQPRRAAVVARERLAVEGEGDDGPARVVDGRREPLNRRRRTRQNGRRRARRRRRAGRRPGRPSRPRPDAPTLLADEVLREGGLGQAREAGGAEVSGSRTRPWTRRPGYSSRPRAGCNGSSVNILSPLMLTSTRGAEDMAGGPQANMLEPGGAYKGQAALPSVRRHLVPVRPRTSGVSPGRPDRRITWGSVAIGDVVAQAK